MMTGALRRFAPVEAPRQNHRQNAANRADGNGQCTDCGDHHDERHDQQRNGCAFRTRQITGRIEDQQLAAAPHRADVVAMALNEQHITRSQLDVVDIPAANSDCDTSAPVPVHPSAPDPARQPSMHTPPRALRGQNR
jgi:hypothetical protein